MEKKGIAVTGLMDKLFNEHLSFGLDVSVDADQFDRRLKLADKYPGLYLSFGFSPAFVQNKYWEKDLGSFDEIPGMEKVRAVGETGLDWHRDYGTREDQTKLFVKQLNFADKYDLPVIIHNRDADKEMIEVLRKFSPGKRGVIHCFTSDYDFAVKVLDLGFYISFAGNLTFRKAYNLHDTARKVPFDRILLETDSPYLSPEPLRGKINTPENIHHTYLFFSELRKIPLEETAGIVARNFEKLFLKKPFLN
jgi:TatD DNase family protein